MKNILNYYYQIIVDDINDSGYFEYNNHHFCLYEYRRNLNEVNSLFLLNNLMISNGICINKIIKNNYNQVITNHDNNNYCLVEIDYQYIEGYSLKYIESFNNSELNILKRNDWGKLWSIKIDYIEYQLKHIRSSYPLINTSVNYYIGMAENAISYFNMLSLNNIPLYISHRRFSYDNMFNPLELVIDYKSRDIGEYLKYCFFNGKMSIKEIVSYINKISLNSIDYLLLYIRLLYPSYYFDLYENIINNGVLEDELNKVIKLSKSYEELLYEVYLLIKNKTSVLNILWLNKNNM